MSKKPVCQNQNEFLQGFVLKWHPTSHEYLASSIRFETWYDQEKSDRQLKIAGQLDSLLVFQIDIMTADWFTPAITTDHRQDPPQKNSHWPADRSHILPQTLRDPRWSIGGPSQIPIPKLQDTPRTYRLWGENQIKSYLCRLPTTVTNKDMQRSPTKIYQCDDSFVGPVTRGACPA